MIWLNFKTLSPKNKNKNMKTKEMNKREVINYLKKCGNHLFTMETPERFIPEERKWIRPEGVWEIKVFIKDNFAVVVTDDTPTIWDIDHLVDTWGANAKCVLKRMIFSRFDYKLGRNLKVRSIPNYKKSRLKWKVIIDQIDEFKDQKEILNTLIKLVKKGE